MGLRQVLTLFFLFSIHTLMSISANLNTYIVHVQGTDLGTYEDLDRWYHSFLPSASNTAEEAPQMVHCYHNVFKGFAARLSPDHLKAMEKKPGFVSAKPHSVLYQDTTHSPNFLGLHQNVGFWRKSNYGKGVIIGVLDGGIFPGHPSFSDEGMPPPPAKWKGKCQFKASLCNKKLIGARDFSHDNGTPEDGNGHGTHTASIAAGNFMRGASVYGYGNGTASGVAPLAHLAIYKVCSDDRRCYDHDVLAAVDAAIDDGVDVLSMSLRGKISHEPFYASAIALGAYSAVQKGIFVSCSAGNGGPFRSSVSNDAPWILTVGASSTDRKLGAVATLGNGEELHGESTYTLHEKKFWENFVSKQFPLYYPDGNCSWWLLHDKRVKGKIVVCESGFDGNEVLKGINVKYGGGLGMIVINRVVDAYTTCTGAHTLPVAHLSYEDRCKLIAYMNSTSSPTAEISSRGTLIGDSLAPQVASFSGRGPSFQGRGVLKPDIVGPGVNIIGAWPISIGVISPHSTNLKTYFGLLSGTSMSCPHLSGIASLLKSSHPDWSPAAIKSAIMTTADISNLAKNPIQDEKLLTADLFATGSGHVNPTKADDPGLVYDIDPEDYLSYLCGLNYTNAQIGRFGNQKVKCTTIIPQAQLNYPSFSIVFGEKVQKYTRTVTNVGEAQSIYTVDAVPPLDVKVTVQPPKLSFSKLNQKLTYEVTFELVKPISHVYVGQGSIIWTSQRHSVRIPIVAQPQVN